MTRVGSQRHKKNNLLQISFITYLRYLTSFWILVKTGFFWLELLLWHTSGAPFAA